MIFHKRASFIVFGGRVELTKIGRVQILSNDGQRQRILQKLGNDFLKSII
jgi:hypothetical protein